MARHLKAIDDEICQLIYREIPERVLVVRMPPRHGKSELVSHWTPAWHKANWPEKNILLASYESSFASMWGRKSRDSFVNAVASFPGMLLGRPDPGRFATSDWGTTAGGYMATAGVGGPFTGKGGHLLLVDDLIKNSEEAQSETFRRKTWEWFTSTLWTRLEPGGVMIVIGTPWHRDDYLARLRDWEEPIREINLPAVAESEDDYLGREIGEPLWPARFDREALRKIELAQGNYYWKALYQGRPTLHDEAEWDEEYFRDIFVPHMPHAFEMGAVGVDPSKGRKKGDFWASVFAGINGGVIYVDSIVRRMPAEVGIERTADLAALYRADVTGVEATQFQELLAPMLDGYIAEHRMTPIDIVPIENLALKEIRIRRLGSWLRQRRLRFLDTPDNRLLVSQMQDFPLGDHDDGPDALEMAIRMLSELAVRSGVAGGDFVEVI